MKHWEHAGDTDEPMMSKTKTQKGRMNKWNTGVHRKTGETKEVTRVTRGYNLENKKQDIAELII